MATNARTHIGISGWTYAPWRGVFFPKKHPQKQELQYASQLLNSIEINGSFYSMQRPNSFQSWYEATPEDFVFSVKGPQYITHRRRLKDVEAPLANFLASGLLGLRQKLGPVLWQLPPNLKFDAERVAHFFKLLPHDTEGAATMARQHDDWMKDRSLTETDANRPLRHAIEIRNESFANSEFVELLRKYRVALCFADSAGLWPYAEDLTADFVYLRLHGAEKIYSSGYTPSALDGWHDRIALWQEGKEPPDAKHWSEVLPPQADLRDAYVYFDNDVKVKAPFDAMALADRFGPSAQGAGRTAPVHAPELTEQALAERVRSHWPLANAAPEKKAPEKSKPKSAKPRAAKPRSSKRSET